MKYPGKELNLFRDFFIGGFICQGFILPFALYTFHFNPYSWKRMKFRLIRRGERPIKRIGWGIFNFKNLVSLNRLVLLQILETNGR